MYRKVKSEVADVYFHFSSSMLALRIELSTSLPAISPFTYSDNG